MNLADHGRARPDAIAVVHGDLRVTYRSLAQHVVFVADDLTDRGLRPGQIAGVVASDRYLHLLILLAAQALGVTTMSLAQAELGAPARLDGLCDRIIMADPSSSGSDKMLSMPRDWLQAILGWPVTDRGWGALERDPDPDFRVRLIKSSGTTGVPKVMGMTHRVQQGVIEKILLHAPPFVLAHPDFLCLYNFAVRAAHARVLLTLQQGGTVQFTGANVIWDQLASGIGNYAMFVAGDLERLVRTVRHGSGPFASLYLEVIGAAVPPQLRQAVQARVTPHIMVTYSSNETNRIAVVEADNVGTLFPDVRVKIVDPQGETVPLGQKGVIHVRTDTMTDGYIDAPALTRAAFVGGWFRTGDIGFQPEAGKLVVLGRDDDMLNIGGVKIAPGPIEQHLKSIDGVRDALVTSIDDHFLTRVMLVAVEIAPQANPAEVTRRITPILRTQVPHFQLLLLPALPRTETGKIRRDAVAALYRQRGQSLRDGEPG
jgi:acyl-coenzyme A synthetase/AMP-(fatty) acid ligase